jgi:molybdate transport system regulatory protein
MSIIGPLKLNVQLLRDGEPAIGPGKAMVLEAIAREGSISAAGRALGMSYRRIWLLVDSLNKSWIEPVVATHSGGGAASGAALTPFGRTLLATYLAVEAEMVAAAQGPKLDWLVASLRRA